MEGDGEAAPAPLSGRALSNVRMAGVKAPALSTLARDVPVMGTATGSLGGAFQFEGGVVDYVARPPALVGAKNAYSMYVEGPSMVPEHNPGDLRFIHPDRKVHVGDSVVITAKYTEHGPYECFIKPGPSHGRSHHRRAAQSLRRRSSSTCASSPRSTRC